MKTETFTVCSFPLIVNIGILAQKDEQGTVRYYVAVNGEVAGEGKETIKEAIQEVGAYLPMRQFVWAKMAHATSLKDIG